MKIGIVGATGAVGTELINVLATRKFPVSSLLLFASERSAGKEVKTEAFGTVTIQVYSLDAAKDLDIVFFAASGGFALKHAKDLAAQGPVVIDNSSAFRYDDDVPLIVPEINPEALEQKKLIANPNCTTAIAVLALWPIHKLCGLKRVIVSTYQVGSPRIKSRLVAVSFKRRVRVRVRANTRVRFISARVRRGYAWVLRGIVLLWAF